MSTSIGTASSPSPMSSGRMPLSLLVDEASEARRPPGLSSDAVPLASGTVPPKEPLRGGVV